MDMTCVIPQARMNAAKDQKTQLYCTSGRFDTKIASANVALPKMWRTRDKRFCGVQKPAPYATYLRVDDRCPPLSVEDRSCTTNYLSDQPLLLAIERDPMWSLASAS